jgi:hypothetical protein
MSRHNPELPAPAVDELLAATRELAGRYHCDAVQLLHTVKVTLAAELAANHYGLTLLGSNPATGDTLIAAMDAELTALGG